MLVLEIDILNIEFKIFILLCMIQLHIIDDYCLQGKLASFKQKNWWKENYPDKLYKHDYLIALMLHAFSWTFMVMLPVILYKIVLGELNIIFYILFLINWLVHAFIDDVKANKLKINLTTDQLIHILQILITWVVLIII